MWITILSDNFKDLLETLKTKPTVIIVLSLMFLAGFFINKWTVLKDNSVIEIKATNKEINEIRDSMYNYKYQALYWKNLYEQYRSKSDSLFIETNKVLKPVVELNKDKNE